MKFLFDHNVPDDLDLDSGLIAMGHEVFRVRELMHPQTPVRDFLRFAGEFDFVLVTCNRDAFLAALHIPPGGLIILRRQSERLRERVALLRLLDRAGEQGIRNNINFA